MFLAYIAIMEIGTENFSKSPSITTGSDSNVFDLLKASPIKNNLEHF